MNALRLLATQRFAPLFWVQFLGSFNDNLFKNALVIFAAFIVIGVAEEFHDNIVMLAGAVFILPFFLFSALAGQLSDKLYKDRLIRWLKLAEIAVMIIAVFGFMLANTWLLLVVLFFMGMQSAFFGPLKYGILPQYLHDEELLRGNGLIQMATYLAILVGTALGGVLISLPGQRGPLAISCAVMLVAVSGWWISRKLPPAVPGSPALRVSYNLPVQTWRLLLLAVRDHKGCLLNMLSISWFFFLGSVYLAVLPLYVRDVLHAGAATATLLLTLMSVGIGLGSLLCGLLGTAGNITRMMPPAALLLGLAPLGLFLPGLVDTPVAATCDWLPSWLGTSGAELCAFFGTAMGWGVALDIVVTGLAAGFYIVPLFALLQHRARAENRARVIAATNIIDSAYIMLASAFTLLLRDLLDKVGLGGHWFFLVLAFTHALVMPVLMYCWPERTRPWDTAVPSPSTAPAK